MGIEALLSATTSYDLWLQLGIALLVLFNTAIAAWSRYWNKRENDEIKKDVGDAKSEIITVKTDIGAVKTEVKDIHINTNSMKDQLVDTTKQIGLLEGAKGERERTEALARGESAIETEVQRRLALAKVAETITTANGSADHVIPSDVHIGKVAGNVEIIKEDVKEVGRDVLAVKAEVTKEMTKVVRDGVRQGVEEAKEEDTELRADRKLNK